MEVFNCAPESVIGISAFGEKAVDEGIPLKRASKGMKDTNESGNKIFRFVQGEKEFLDDIGNSLKETVKQVTVFKEKMAEGSPQLITFSMFSITTGLGFISYSIIS